MSLYVTVDFKQFEEYKDKIEKLSEGDVQKFFDDCCKELAARLLGKVIPKTPVGNYDDGREGGTLRRGWTAGKDTNARAYAYSLPVQKVADGYIITVKNMVEYAPYVNYGHRQTIGRYVPQIGKKLKRGFVEGQFFLEKSEMELGSELPNVIKNKMMKFLKETLE